MCVCMCIYRCMYMCVCVCGCACVYMYIYIYACVYIRMCMYIFICMSSSYTNFIHDGVLYHLFLSFLNVFYFITILSMLSFYIELTFLICSFYVTITLRVCVYLYSCVRKCYCACYFILCIELQIFFYCTFVLLSQQWLNKDAQSIWNYDVKIQIWVLPLDKTILGLDLISFARSLWHWPSE